MDPGSGWVMVCYDPKAFRGSRGQRPANWSVSLSLLSCPLPGGKAVRYWEDVETPSLGASTRTAGFHVKLKLVSCAAGGS